MLRVVVAGYGNPLRGDDGAAWHVVDAIAQRWADRVQVLLGQQPVPEWALVLSGADVAFMVDACIEGNFPLQLRRVAPNLREASSGAHEFGLEALLHLTQSAFGRAPRAYLLALPTDNLDFGDELSPRAERAVSMAIELLDRRLTSLVGPLAV